MNTEIYYFSGTGNSFAVARDLAGRMDAKLVPIMALSGMERIETNAEKIGFVFPSYDFKPPLAVREFVKKFKDLGSKYLFAVATYGIIPSSVIKSFDQIVKECGGHLSTGFAVKMPHNGIGSGGFSKEMHEAMLKNWKVRLEAISPVVIAGETRKLESSDFLFSMLSTGLIIKMLPTLFNLLKQVITKGWDSMALQADEKCDGCGICQKLCPADNIQIVERKPIWLNHCAGCLACLHWCPKEAVHLGFTGMNIRHYHHPEVKLPDMIKQAEYRIEDKI